MTIGAAERQKGLRGQVDPASNPSTKLNAGTSAARSQRALSRSPTPMPMPAARHRSRRSLSGRRAQRLERTSQGNDAPARRTPTPSKRPPPALRARPLEAGEQAHSASSRCLNPRSLPPHAPRGPPISGSMPAGADATAVTSSWQLTQELLKPLLAQVGCAESALLQPSAEARHVPQLAGDRARRVATALSLSL